MWGLHGAADPIFPAKKLATFLVITVRVSAVSSPQKLAICFLLITLVSLGVAHYFLHAKIRRSFCGPLFVGRTC